MSVDVWSGVRTVNGSVAAPCRAGKHRKHKLTADGAADLAPPRSDTGTVPDHAFLGSLVGCSHSVRLLVDLIVALFLCYKWGKQWDNCVF